MKVKIQNRKRRVAIVVDHGHWEMQRPTWLLGRPRRIWVPARPIPPISKGLKPWDGRPGRWMPPTSTMDGRKTKMAKMMSIFGATK